ncbi:hypothetical protein UY3_05535 [Chelonia mydas]|uniref:Uncharacterized protein n=1 Tax=Chelonia mydas TaxID=8469 RepID=M7BH40_CHEMY|nr:hypothetical protein UY3_05535 [Chelonia mydas]
MAKHTVVHTSMLSPPSYYDAVHEGRGPATPDYPFHGGFPSFQDMQYHQMSPGQEAPSFKRRGGVVDHRDVIMAHQAHKIHSTPQARRKEWDVGITFIERKYCSDIPQTMQLMTGYCNSTALGTLITLARVKYSHFRTLLSSKKMDGSLNTADSSAARSATPSPLHS